MIAKLGRQHKGIHWRHIPDEHLIRQLVQTQLDLILPSVHGYCLVALGELADDFTFEKASVVNVLRLNAGLNNAGWVDYANLPLSVDDVDAIFIPFQIEQCQDPHSLLRESYRILRPGGKLIVCSFNPISLWGLRRLFRAFDHNPLWRVPFYSTSRLMDWFSILDFEVKLRHSLLNPLWLKKYIQGDTIISSATYSVLGCMNLFVAEKRLIPLTLKPKWQKLKSTAPVGMETLRKTMYQKPVELGKGTE